MNLPLRQSRRRPADLHSGWSNVGAIDEAAWRIDEDAASVPLEDVLSSFFAYYGTYAVDQGAGTVTHEVAGSLAPTWIGSDQVRAYEIIDRNRLRLTARLQDDDVLASAGAGGTNVLIWERIGGSLD